MPASPRRRTPRAALALVAVGALAAPLTAAAPAQADARRVLPFVRPAWVGTADDRGVVAADATVPFEMLLDLQDAAGAAALAAAVSTPGDPQYRHFLAPADWIARFAPTQQAFDAAAADLTGAGLTLAADQPASREYLLGSGPAGLVAREFGTSLHTGAVRGALRVAAASAPRVPSALAGTAAAVAFGAAPVHSLLVRPEGRTAGTPCSAWWDQHEVTFPRTRGATRASTPLCGYSAAGLRTVGGLDAQHGVPETGAGTTIAVLDAFGAAGTGADLAAWSAEEHLAAPAYRELVAPRGSWTQSDGCRAADWQPEEALDLEAAHAVAPRASLLYVGAADCGFGVDAALSRVLDGGLADVVSQSFGTDAEPDAPDLVLHQHLQAAAEGIAIAAASGDDGDESAVSADGGTAIGFPASSPWVTAVGGTTVALGRHGERVVEAAWGDELDLGRVDGSRVRWAAPLPGRLLGGAGGGASRRFARPGFQAGPVPWSLSHGARTTSDVAALASPFTGFRIAYRTGGRWTRLVAGGTSLATPVVAAELALAEQRAGHRLGFVDPALYAAASTLRDVRPSPTARLAAARKGASLLLLTLGHDGALAARTGYDLPTGLGVITPATIAALARG